MQCVSVCSCQHPQTLMQLTSSTVFRLRERRHVKHTGFTGLYVPSSKTIGLRLLCEWRSLIICQILRHGYGRHDSHWMHVIHAHRHSQHGG